MLRRPPSPPLFPYTTLFRSSSGAIVVIDIATGEVLAMVDQPAFNPNDRDQMRPGRYRNRAVTDVYEPGSSMKPFFVAAGLDRKSTRLNSSHPSISYAVFCLK